MEAAPWAAPGRLFQDFGLGLDAAYEKKEAFNHDCAPGPGAAGVDGIKQSVSVIRLNSGIHTTSAQSRQAGTKCQER
jgi:hypothetical protein